MFRDVTAFIQNGRLVSSTCEEFNGFLNTLSENGNVKTYVMNTMIL